MLNTLNKSPILWGLREFLISLSVNSSVNTRHLKALTFSPFSQSNVSKTGKEMLSSCRASITVTGWSSRFCYKGFLIPARNLAFSHGSAVHADNSHQLLIALCYVFYCAFLTEQCPEKREIIPSTFGFALQQRGCNAGLRWFLARHHRAEEIPS